MIKMEDKEKDFILRQLKSLGLEIPATAVRIQAKAKAKPRHSLKPADPYYLLVTTRCNLCGSTFSEGFEMRNCPITESLTSKKSPLPLPSGHRSETRKVNKCRFCSEALKEFDKTYLISRLLERTKI